MPVHPPAGLLPCIIHDGSLQISPKYILVKRNSLGNGADSYWSPPAHSFLTRPPIGRHFSPAQPSDCLAIDFPGRAISPGEDLLFPPLRHHTFSPKGVAKLSFTARIKRALFKCSFQGRLSRTRQAFKCFVRVVNWHHCLRRMFSWSILGFARSC